MKMATRMQAEMESNRLKGKEIDEKKRANKAQESLTKRGQDFKFAGDLVSGGSKVLANLAKNHPSWYTKFSELADQAGKIVTGHPAGIPLDLAFIPEGSQDNEIEYWPNQTVAPSCVAVVPYAPVLGRSHYGMGIVKDISQRIYTFIRHFNSGSANYDPTEYMMYLLAVSALYEYHGYLTRVYGLLNTYNVLNRNTPRLAIEALDLNFDDLLLHLADLKALIQNLEVHIGAFAVPEDFAIVARRYFLNLNVFKDRNSDKAQMFMYTPKYLFKYTLVQVSTEVVRSKLTPVYLYGNANDGLVTRGFSDLKNIMTELVTALYYNEDIGIMSGDTLKAFKNSRMYSLPSIKDDFKIIPTWDENVAIQFHNTRLVHIIPGATTWVVDQVNGEIQDATITASFDGYTDGENEDAKRTYFMFNNKTLLDVPYNDISRDQAFVYTRNIVGYDVEYDPSIKCDLGLLPYYSGGNMMTGECTVISYGSEIMLGIDIYYNRRGIGNAMVTTKAPTLYEYTPSCAWGMDSFDMVGSVVADSILTAVFLLSTFETFPRVNIISIGLVPNSEGDPYCLRKHSVVRLWDTDNLNTIGLSQLDLLHYAALYSEYNVKLTGFEK